MDTFTTQSQLANLSAKLKYVWIQNGLSGRCVGTEANGLAAEICQTWVDFKSDCWLIRLFVRQAPAAVSGPVFSTGGVLWGQEGSASPCRKRTCLPNLECHQHQPLYARRNEGLPPAGSILVPDKGTCAHWGFFCSFFLLPVDNPPCWLHVPVHSVFWGADYGPLEVCVAPETSAYFLPSTCWCGLLQGWDAHKHTHTERTVV